MSRAVRAFGAESIFTKGSASGDWQQRQHPSDLVQPPAPYFPAECELEMVSGAAAAVGTNHAASARDGQALHVAERIAQLTATVLKKNGVDAATIADAVHVHAALRAPHL